VQDESEDYGDSDLDDDEEGEPQEIVQKIEKQAQNKTALP